MGKCRYDLSEDCNNRDCIKCVLDKITEEIEKYKADCGKPEDIGYFSEVNQRTKGAYETCLKIINYWRNEVS